MSQTGLVSERIQAETAGDLAGTADSYAPLPQRYRGTRKEMKYYGYTNKKQNIVSTSLRGLEAMAKRREART